MLLDQAIQEFKELYKKRYGVGLSDQEASRRADNLFNLYKVTYMPDSIIEPELHKKIIIKKINL